MWHAIVGDLFCELCGDSHTINESINTSGTSIGPFDDEYVLSRKIWDPGSVVSIFIEAFWFKIYDEIIIRNQFKMQVISGMIKVEQITKRTASNPRVYDASSQYHCIIQFHEFIPPVYPIITVVHVRNVSSMMMDESLVSMLFDQIWGGFDNE
eukprot:69156_1